MSCDLPDIVHDHHHHHHHSHSPHEHCHEHIHQISDCIKEEVSQTIYRISRNFIAENRFAFHLDNFHFTLNARNQTKYLSPFQYPKHCRIEIAPTHCTQFPILSISATVLKRQ